MAVGAGAGRPEETAASEFDPELARAFVRMVRMWERRLTVLEATKQEIRLGAD